MENGCANNHYVGNVLKGSPAEKAGVLKGDNLIAVNGIPIEDVFDYRFNILSERLELRLIRRNEEISLVINKEEDEDPGIEFENGLMDDYRSCKNKCIFCFIDQMPPGMRKTLYFKDDDSRLSFLQGNYVTLTNLSDNDVSRIIRFRMEPINISFHTTNPELRCRMLNNRFAGESLKIVDRFFEAGITMNGQIVLCKGINDGDELRRSIEDLSKYLPVLESVSVVPVGLTKFREGLYPLELFDKEDAGRVIDIIESYQKKFYDEFGLHFIHASDEWYITAGRELPEEERYDGYLQLENGVGMVRLLEDEFFNAFDELKLTGIKKKFMKKHECTVITGKLVYPYIKKFADMMMAEYPKLDIDVKMIENDFFGHDITVTGLLTGQDIIKQLKEKGCKKHLLIPQNTMKADEDIFLDDITLSELAETLQVKTDIVKSSGRDMFMKMLKDGE